MREVHVIFSNLPGGPDAEAKFIETEDRDGKGITGGRWEERRPADGGSIRAHLIIETEKIPPEAVGFLRRAAKLRGSSFIHRDVEALASEIATWLEENSLGAP